MMIFMDENGNRTGPPDGWTDNGGDVLSPVRGGPFGIAPPLNNTGNMSGLGLDQVGQSMRPPQASNPFQQFQNSYGGSGVANQIPNSNMTSGGGMLSAMPGYQQPYQQPLQAQAASMEGGWSGGAPPAWMNMNGGSVAGQIPNLNSLMGPPIGQAAPMMPGGAMMSQMGRPQMGGPMTPQMAQIGKQISPQMGNHAEDDGTTDTTDTTGGKGWWETFGESLPGLTTGLATAGTIAGALDSAKNTTATGHAMQDYLTGLGDTLNDGSQFQGYGVSTGLGDGSVKYDDNGQLITDLGLDPATQTQITNMQNASTGNFTDAANAYNAMNAVNSGQSSTDFNAMSGALQGAANGITPGQGAAGGFFGSQMEASQGMAPGQGAFGGQAQDAANRAMADPSQRQGEIYQQMMAMQNPELNRQQGEQQAQEYARGRGGVRGSQYGGTAEDAAMARARANASNQASLNAMQQADSERSTFGQMASQFGQLGNQNYANESNQQSNLANSAAQMAQAGNQNFSNMSSQQNNLANSAAQMGQIGNQNYANMGNYANQLNNSAAAFGGLGNQADSNAIQKMGMLGTMGNQLAQLGQQNYQNSFMPMQQQLAAMDLGMKNANMAQTGQLTGQDYMAQLGLGGANANINAQHSANQLTGNLYNALLSNLGGVQGSDGTAGSGLMGILGDTLGTMFGFGEKDNG